MPGFFATNIDLNIELSELYSNNYLSEKMSIDSRKGLIKRNSLNKFMDDKPFENRNGLYVLLEGYLLNKKTLFKNYCVSNTFDLVHKMYSINGEMFFEEFRGCFSGCIYDSMTDKWIIFTNQIGDNPVFYAYDNNNFFAGSQFGYIVDAYRKCNYNINFNESAAYELLTFGYIPTDSTYAMEIKRLYGGTYLCIDKGQMEVKVYHRFKKNTSYFMGKSDNEIINELDHKFRETISYEYEKDDEYGLKHLTDMSGGLDSRMNAWVAHSLKPMHMQLLTYCKANYDDELIAKQIAFYWKDELLVKPLDDCAFLYDINEIVSMCGGTSLYSGISGGKRLLESIKVEQYGLEHTGMLGDVVIGSFYKNLSDISSKRITGRYSERLSNRLDKNVLSLPEMFDDYEIYLIYARGFRGAANSHLIRKNFIEVSSPFLHVDFLQLCLNIPVEKRIGHQLYKKWIIDKYPEAAKFKWEKQSSKITDNRAVVLLKRIIKRGPDKFKRIILKNNNTLNDMNAMDYWYSHNNELKDALDSYAQIIQIMTGKVSTQLIDDLRKMYAVGNMNEKTMVLTVLSAFKQYFG